PVPPSLLPLRARPADKQAPRQGPTRWRVWVGMPPVCHPRCRRGAASPSRSAKCCTRLLGVLPCPLSQAGTAMSTIVDKSTANSLLEKCRAAVEAVLSEEG